MASSIGIKIANGEFYPLIEENSSVRKKMILTTVHDNQPSTQIDLYRSNTQIMNDSQYIGSLVVENIRPKPKGEPNIELIISSNSNGDIIADAIDLDSSANGEHYVLTVSLKTLDETSSEIEIPDFDLESNEEPPTGLFNQAKKIRQEKQRKSFVWLFILIGLIIILGLLAAWLFFFGGLNTVQTRWPVVRNSVQRNIVEPVKGVFSRNNSQVVVTQQVPVREPEPVREPDPVREPEPVREPDPVVVTEPAPVAQTPAVSAPAPSTPASAAVRRNPSAPVYSFNVPATIPREGVDYRIRWGDTLWDISNAFYRDPWLYPRIASHNNIRNPNFIISGRIIRIPPRN